MKKDEKKSGIRKDVEKIIFEKTKKTSSDEVVFKAYASSDEIGQKIFESYKKRRTEQEGRKVFYSNERTKDAGFLSNVYGNVGIMALVNRMNVKLDSEDTKELVDNIYYIIDYIEENGYSLFPYIDKEDNRIEGVELFNRNYPYIGSMTWVLSFLVSVRKAHKSGVIDISKEYSEKIIDRIKDIIEKFNASFIDKGDVMGWSFTKECETPSLFFTYSVLEAYSDFDDNIIALDSETEGSAKGEALDKELLKAINKGRKENEEIHEIWKENCFKVADKVWVIYKDVLKDSFVDDNFMKGFKTISRDDILKSNSSNALFNTIYLVFILFYGYVNARMADKNDETGAADVVLTMGSALQNVQRVYNQFRKEGLDYIIDTYYIVFNSKHQDERRRNAYTRKLNPKKLVDAKLMPTLVKANNVIAFHIDKYPLKQMSQLFEELLENLPKTSDEFVWEAGEYDVKITERYIEAIADFYAYYDKYERLYSDNFNRNNALTQRQRKELEERTIRNYADGEKAKIEKEFEQKEEKIRGEYTIENAIREKTIKEFETGVISLMKNVIEGNEGKRELSGFEKEFAGLMYRLMVSYTYKELAKVSVEKRIEVEELRERRDNDIDMFVSAWSEKLSKKSEVISGLLTEEDK